MIRSLILIMVLFFLTACGENPPVPVDRFYNLNLKDADITSAKLSDDVIYIEGFRADGIYNERALLYTDDSSQHELQQYHYHFWALPPAAMLREHLVEYLRKAGAAPVILADYSAGDGISISGKLLGFEKRVYEEKTSVRVAIEFRLDKPGEDRPGLIKRYESEQEISEQTIHDVVTGFNQAVDEVYAEFLADASQAL